jgi:hypothetical protein
MIGTRRGAWIPKVASEAPFDALAGLIRQSVQPPQSTAIARREVLEAVGGYDVSYLYSQDYDLWLRLAESGPFVCTDRLTGSYRWHDAQISQRRRIEQLMEAHRARHDAIDRATPRGIDRRGLRKAALHRTTEDLALLWRTEDWDGAGRLLAFARKHHVISGPRALAWQLALRLRPRVGRAGATMVHGITAPIRRWMKAGS